MTFHSVIDQRLAVAPVVPLIAEDNPVTAVKLAEALQAGGLTVIKVVMRSGRALDGLKSIIAETEGVVVGAGTVLTRDQAERVHDAGSAFVVSPGLVDEIVEFCLERAALVVPGVMTAREAQRAYALGLREVKFVPASLTGGVPMLKAFGAVLGDMRFMPTGGVTASNLVESFRLQQVLACGGSWLILRDLVTAGNFASIEQLARDAVKIAEWARNQETGNV